MLARNITPSPVAVIAVSSEDPEFEWLTRVQEAVGNNKEVILYSQDEPLEGLLGFVNCLRREPDSGNVRGVITYEAKPFDMEDGFYKKQLNKNLAISVYKDGAWGTYRHLLLEDVEDLEPDHCYVNQTARGDLSSLRWIEGPIAVKESDQTDNPLIKVSEKNDLMTIINESVFSGTLCCPQFQGCDDSFWKNKCRRNNVG